ncbi:MAG: hypothetical protein AB7F89_00970 [Pirellulaceae bacterium]
MTESGAAVEYSIRARFDEICQRLKASQLTDRLEKPVGYWALTGDRRLPYALLERRVSEIVHTPFKELARTPAIGKKKLGSLVVLLERVLADQQPVPPQAAEQPGTDLRDDFQLESVSESLWELWRETVRTFQLGHEPLGRFAPSLRTLPTVIWDAPLSTYLDMPLGQMRQLKTHGDKRVRNVVEIFYHLHQILGPARVARHLVVQVRPGFITAVEQWVLDAMRRADVPSLQDLRQGLVLPLLNQIEADGDETIGRLLAGRIGVESPPESAIEQAERLNVTRARIYQLLEQAARIMRVRWPEGRWQLTALAAHLRSLTLEDERQQMLNSLRTMIYPDKLRSDPIRTDPMPTVMAAATPA